MLPENPASALAGNSDATGKRPGAQAAALVAETDPGYLIEPEHPCRGVGGIVRLPHEVDSIQIGIGGLGIELHAGGLRGRCRVRGMIAIILVMRQHVLLAIIGNEIAW